MRLYKGMLTRHRDMSVMFALCYFDVEYQANVTLACVQRRLIIIMVSVSSGKLTARRREARHVHTLLDGVSWVTV